MTSQIKQFIIPDKWKDDPNHSVSVEMPPFTKVISVGYNGDETLVVWGIVRNGGDDGGVGFTFQIRKSGETLGSGNFDARFIDMVNIDNEPHAVFLGGIA